MTSTLEDETVATTAVAAAAAEARKFKNHDNEMQDDIDLDEPGSSSKDKHVQQPLEFIHFGENEPDEDDEITSSLKKHLHIKSEQRRRKRISDGFEALKDKVPSIKSGYESKASTLFKAAEYIDALRFEIDTLKIQLNAFKQLYSKMADPAGINNYFVRNDEKNAANPDEKASSPSTPSGENKKVEKKKDCQPQNKNDASKIPTPSVVGSPTPHPPFFFSGPHNMPMPMPVHPPPRFDSNGNLIPFPPLFLPMNMPPPPHMLSGGAKPIVGVIDEESSDFMQPTVPYYFSEEFREKMQVNQTQESTEAVDGQDSKNSKKPDDKDGPRSSEVSSGDDAYYDYDDGDDEETMTNKRKMYYISKYKNKSKKAKTASGQEKEDNNDAETENENDDETEQRPSEDRQAPNSKTKRKVATKKSTK